MINSEARFLIKKYLNGNCTPEEKKLVEDWYITKTVNQPYPSEETNYEETAEEIWMRIKMSQTHLGVRNLRSKIAAVAAILIITIGCYFVYNNQKSEKKEFAKIEDAEPAKNSAILTLASGKKFFLTNVQSGTIAYQGKAKIQQLGNGLLVNSQNVTDARLIYDTLTTPRSGVYNLTLPDGSKVWLNAETSIRFPANFSNKERRIELIYGEVYFEVVHNKLIPFRVQTRSQTVEDVGTRFNVNSLEENIGTETTLLEGSVRILSGAERRLLVPGEQAVSSRASNSIVVKSVDLDDVMAWKNGQFLFDNTDLDMVMQQLSKWYNVTVIYQGKKPVENYHAQIRRNCPLSVVLHMLETTGSVKFTMEDHQIIVRNK